MERRVLVLFAVAAAAAAVVGLSAAATLTRGDAREPATGPAPVSKATGGKASRVGAARTVKTRKADEAPAVATSGAGQNLQRVEEYWTKERMSEAQPREQVRPRGSSSPSKGQSGPTAPGSQPSKSTSTKRTSNATESSGIETSPGTGTLDGALDDPAPMEKSRPPLGTPEPDPRSDGSSVPGSPSS